MSVQAVSPVYPESLPKDCKLMSLEKVAQLGKTSLDYLGPIVGLFAHIPRVGLASVLQPHPLARVPTTPDSLQIDPKPHPDSVSSILCAL